MQPGAPESDADRDCSELKAATVAPNPWSQMQEQPPLRPAEFAKIRDGFIAFLKQPPETPLQAIIPADVLDAMASTARRGRKRRWWLDFVRLASVLIVGIGIVLIIAPDPIKTGFGLGLLLGGGTAFILAHFRTKVRDELDIDEIVTQPDEALERNLRALDDFRNLIASGDIPCAERRPDGTVKPLGKNALRAFLADHGALLILSREQDLWRCIPHRPVPMSALWIKLGSRVAPMLVTSRTLLDTADQDIFDRRIAWLLSHSDQPSAQAHAFREALQIVIALRRPDLDGMTFERKKEILRGEGKGVSRIEKIHAGIYPPFNDFLRNLPMREFP